MVDVAAPEAAKSSRREVSKRSFVNAAGEYTGRVNPDSIGFKIEFVETGDTIEQQLTDFSDGVRNAAALFGLVTSITNTFGGVKVPEEAIAAAQERLEILLEGDWASERQSGPRSSHILEAAVAVRADAGKDTTDEWKDKFLAAIKADENYVKELAKDPAFAAKLAAIKAKAAQERAAKAAEKAKDAGTSVLLDD